MASLAHSALESALLSSFKALDALEASEDTDITLLTVCEDAISNVIACAKSSNDDMDALHVLYDDAAELASATATHLKDMRFRCRIAATGGGAAAALALEIDDERTDEKDTIVKHDNAVPLTDAQMAQLHSLHDSITTNRSAIVSRKTEKRNRMILSMLTTGMEELLLEDNDSVTAIANSLPDLERFYVLLRAKSRDVLFSTTLPSSMENLKCNSSSESDCFAMEEVKSRFMALEALRNRVTTRLCNVTIEPSLNVTPLSFSSSEDNITELLPERKLEFNFGNHNVFIERVVRNSESQLNVRIMPPLSKDVSATLLKSIRERHNVEDILFHISSSDEIISDIIL